MSQTPATAWTVPTRRGAAWFRLRVWGHVLLRGFGNLMAPRVKKHQPTERLGKAPVIAEHRTPLWREARDDEFPLVAGKVHNLRIARSAFDGVVVRAGCVFSFWRQLGRPSRWRGFVEGREVRAGCVVPTVAGGLCQLSNALAACAAGCGITLLERHQHTARLMHEPPGDARPESSDATVLWNYVDLRFVPTFDVRIEVELTADELVVRMRAAGDQAVVGHMPAAGLRAIPVLAERSAVPVARGCLTCNETSCFRHRDGPTTTGASGTAVLVNAWTAEFARYLHSRADTAEWFVPWVRPSRRPTGAWTQMATGTRSVAVVASMRRSLLLRRLRGEGGHRQAALMCADQWIAEAHSKCLEAWHTHLIVDQTLLVPLAQSGALGGRTYEVLVHALPADEIQRRLDAAAARWPSAGSLRDFRVASAYCEAERRALRGAQRLVTPHAEVARHLRATCGARVDCIDWHMPPQRLRDFTLSSACAAQPVVAFPASALARKGALDLAQAMRELGWRLLVLGTPPSDAGMWSGVDVEYVGYRNPAWLGRADMVALPAYVEHSPRALLAAIAQGIPVIASPECGLPSSLGALEVSPGDIPGLIAALKSCLESARSNYVALGSITPLVRVHPSGTSRTATLGQTNS